MCASKEVFSEKAEILRLISSCKNGWKHGFLSSLTVLQLNSLGNFTDMLLSLLCMISLEAVSICVIIMIFHCMHLVCVELLDDVFLLAVSGLSFALHFVCFSLCRLMIFSFCVDCGEAVLRFAFLHNVVIIFPGFLLKVTAVPYFQELCSILVTCCFVGRFQKDFREQCSILVTCFVGRFQKDFQEPCNILVTCFVGRFQKDFQELCSILVTCCFVGRFQKDFQELCSVLVTSCFVGRFQKDFQEPCSILVTCFVERFQTLAPEGRPADV